MEELIGKAEELREMVKTKRIDNVVLKTSMLSELDFFIDNVGRGDEED